MKEEMIAYLQSEKKELTKKLEEIDKQLNKLGVDGTVQESITVKAKTVVSGIAALGGMVKDKLVTSVSDTVTNLEEKGKERIAVHKVEKEMNRQIEEKMKEVRATLKANLAK